MKFPLPVCNNFKMAGVLVKLYDECKDGNFESLNALLKINYEKNENDILFGGKVSTLETSSFHFFLFMVDNCYSFVAF